MNDTQYILYKNVEHIDTKLINLAIQDALKSSPIYTKGRSSKCRKKK